MSSKITRIFKNIIEKTFRKLAQDFVKKKKPLVIAVAGSVGKTSSKMMLAQLLATEKKVSCMDDSYNTGLGLYMSVFEQKVPRKNTPINWLKVYLKAKKYARCANPEILIVEYGIDHPGDMDEMVSFIQPDISLLTAVTPEHMESMKTMDAVGLEETKVINCAKKYGIVNTVDVSEKYQKLIKTEWFGYGDDLTDAHYKINKIQKDGANVTFCIENESYENVKLRIIAEHTIREMAGAMLLAQKIGISREAIEKQLPKIRSASSRMNLLEGVNGSVIIDDTANFSPVAGVSALKTFGSISAKRHIALLGNMHELGDFEKTGFKEVSKHFDKVNILILVGDLATKYFKPLAIEQGFIEGNNLLEFSSSPEAGIYMRDKLLRDGDLILAKGPFGKWYIEEAVIKILRNKSDKKYVTRQSEFWDIKKRQKFGDLMDK